MVQEYSYVYNGGTLMQMVIETTVDDGTPVAETLSFSYDASGMPMSVVYNGTAYFYTVNLQGDVVAIVDATGTAVVSYAYDAWGNILSVAGTIADTLGESNPLRYRGYYYDSEFGLYYLQSRYYDPELCRFINADSYASTGQGILGCNMFAYCRNNPVCRKDISGTTDEALPEDGTDLLDEKKTFEGGKMGDGGSSNSVKRIGGGHGNPTHKERIDDHMDKLEKTGKYSTIYGNRSLKTAGLVGNQCPDVIAVGYNGQVEVWEFASSSQAFLTSGYYTLEAKISAMQAANPSVVFHAIIHW